MARSNSRSSSGFWSRTVTIDRRGVRTGARTSTRSARISRRNSSRLSRRSRDRSDGAHLALLAISAVIVFQIIGIASNFNSSGVSANPTGYVVANSATSTQSTGGYSVIQTYSRPTAGCDNYLDSNNPYSEGYSVYNNGQQATARDSCIDRSTLAEYYCDQYGNLNTNIVQCAAGCLTDGAYGYCA